jgi:phosphatidylglycerol---prolipoprotein diacylglyceryl transferase
VGLALHRTLACFMAGCCYGKPTDMPWGVMYPPSAKAFRSFGGVPVHPTQIYEAILGLFMFTVLVLYRGRKNRAPGELFALQLLIYGAGRFIIEFFRGDTDRGGFGPFSTSQWLGLGMCVAFIIVIIYTRRQKRILSKA